MCVCGLRALGVRVLLERCLCVYAHVYWCDLVVCVGTRVCLGVCVCACVRVYPRTSHSNVSQRKSEVLPIRVWHYRRSRVLLEHLMLAPPTLSVEFQARYVVWAVRYPLCMVCVCVCVCGVRVCV